MVNLLPLKDQMKLRVRYYTSLASVFVFLLVGLSVVGIALLLPSYFLAQKESDTALRELAISAESVKAYQSSGTVQQISLLKERLAILKENDQGALSALVLSRLTSDLSADIQVQSISLTFTGKGKGGVVVAGLAKTRTGLITFGKNLESERIFTGAVVPVSDLASETNLAFSIPFTFDVGTP